MLIKPYLIGDIYSIQPIHTGKLFLFLKKPENKITGSRIIGVAADTAFTSDITLPKSKPSELPDNWIKNDTK